MVEECKKMLEEKINNYKITVRQEIVDHDPLTKHVKFEEFINYKINGEIANKINEIVGPAIETSEFDKRVFEKIVIVADEKTFKSILEDYVASLSYIDLKKLINDRKDGNKEL